MAHKKSGGSSANGRDSIGRRLGLKSPAASALFRVTSSFVSAVPNIIRALTSVWVKTTLFSPYAKVRLNFLREPAKLSFQLLLNSQLEKTIRAEGVWQTSPLLFKIADYVVVRLAIMVKQLFTEC